MDFREFATLNPNHSDGIVITSKERDGLYGEYKAFRDHAEYLERVLNDTIGQLETALTSLKAVK